VFAGRRATGARVIRDSRTIDLRAPTVIVAAGAFGSPAMLQRSGIGAAAELAGLGIEPLVDRPGVGRSMANHPYAALLFAPTADYVRSGQATAPREVGQVLLRHRVAGGDPDGWDLMLGAWCAPALDPSGRPSGPLVAGILATISKPRSTGSVAIRSADPAELPAIHHNFLGDPGGRDLDLLAHGLRLARTISRTAPFARLVERELEPGPGIADADLSGWAARSVLGDYHPCGTCRMGDLSDPHAVLGPDGGVIGIDGLFVVDASVFPTIPRANIHLTVLGAAERFAELLAAR
jgi:choline dehydrogenase